MSEIDLKKVVLATIAYYDCLEFPLTLLEVHRFLINPKRIFTQVHGMEEVSIEMVADALDRLLADGSIEQQLGTFILKGHLSYCSRRLEMEKIAAQKWRKFFRKIFWLQSVPWIQGVFASGSLALGNTTSESDFDVLVLVKPGRLYIARLLLSGLTSLMGMRRTRYETTAPDKFCFNHYITTDDLRIRHESLYNAQTYAHLVPVWARGSLNANFFTANIWMNKFVYNFRPHQEMIRRNIQRSKFLTMIAQTMEFLLDNRLGDKAEFLARSYQQKRIKNNPMTHAPGGRVVFTDAELEFHPRSFEQVVLKRYNGALLHLNISITPEPDSGLRS